MRQVGSIADRSQADQFAAYLVTQGISCTVNESPSGMVIWVHEEDRVTSARDELARFRTEPEHERYRAAEHQAAVIVKQRQQQAAATRQRTVDPRERWARPTASQGPATFGLMAVMVAVAVLTGINPAKHEEFLRKMVFSNDGTMDAIWSGEAWRLVTPIFLHFTTLHFLFNLLCLRDFGLMVEARLGTAKYCGLILLLAVVSNYAQFTATGGRFGGMSGVVYGLFGFAWVRSRMDPGSGLWVSKGTVTIMIGWQIMCLLFIPNVANWAHGMGLIVGAALGASRPLLRR